MFTGRRTISNQFYPSCGAPLIIDANPHERPDLERISLQDAGIAVSVVLNPHGEISALPFQQSQSAQTPLALVKATRLPPLSLDELLSTLGGRSILVDVNGTSPRLIDEFKRLVERHNCIDQLCCGSRFDGVGERLLASLPRALHFMPRAARARVTLGLLLNDNVPNVGAYSVINLPTSFEGLDVVNEAMVHQLTTLGLHLNVISDQTPVEQQRLATMGVSGMIMNAFENRASSRSTEAHVQRRPA